MTTAFPPTRFLTVGQLAEVLGCSRQTVYRLSRAGELRPLRLGSGPRPRLRFPATELDRLQKVPAAGRKALATAPTTADHGGSRGPAAGEATTTTPERGSP